MTKRSYDQTCGLATALDLLGERWTMLILRDLVLGPQRYTDLLEGLPGIGTNLLANRLKELERLCIVRRRELPPPAASTVYELTEEARDLEPALAGLGRWGARYMELSHDTVHEASPRLVVLGICMSFTPEVALPLEGSIFDLRLGGLEFELSFAGSRAHARQRRVTRPDATIETDVATLLGIATKRLARPDAEAAGLLTIEGDRGAAERLLDTMDLSWVGEAVRAEGAEAAPA